MKIEKPNSENRIVERLMEEYGYPKDSIRTGVSLSKGQARYKADVVVYDHGKPFMVVEIKSHLRRPTWASEEQLRKYLSASEAKYGIITDGISHFCYRAQETPAGIILEKLPDIPQLDSIDGKNISKEHSSKYLNDITWHEFNHLRGKTTSQLSTLLDISKIIAAKFYDENENKIKHSFYTNVDDDAETVKSRIESILLYISQKIGLASHAIELEAQDVKNMVFRLQKYTISKSELTKDGLNILYPKIITEYELSQLITPLNLIKFSIGLANIQKNYQIIDPACGLGGFLVEASKYGAQISGVDISQTVVDIAKINMYLIGKDPLRIVCHDSLKFFTKFGFDSQEEHIEKYDLVIMNPPFNYKIMDERLDNFHLTKSSGGFSENLFMELGTKLVRNNGKIIMIVPEGFLFNSQNERIREFLVKNFRIAVISLPVRMFTTSTIKTSIIVLTKSKPDPNQQVFFAKVIPIDVKKNSTEEYEKQFGEIITAFKEYQKFNMNYEYSKNIILTRVSDSKRLDFAYFEKINLEKFQHPTMTLSEIAVLQVGAKMDTLKEKTGEFDALLIGGQNIKDSLVDLSSISPVKIDLELNYRYVTKNFDILMTRTGNPGKVAIVKQGNTPQIIKDNLICIRPNLNAIDPYYLLAFLSSKEGQEILQKISTGSIVKAINLQNLATLRIPIPSLEEQRKISGDLMELLRLKNEIKSLETETGEKRKLLDQKINTLFQGGKSND